MAKPIIVPPEIDAEMTPAVRAFVAALIGRIEKLEARLALNPQNSSLPPSSQHPHAKPPREKKKGPKKKRGGQPGHPRHQRELIASCRLECRAEKREASRGLRPQPTHPDLEQKETEQTEGGHPLC
jgi:hypothetical protein